MHHASKASGSVRALRSLFLVIMLGLATAACGGGDDDDDDEIELPDAGGGGGAGDDDQDPGGGDDQDPGGGGGLSCGEIVDCFNSCTDDTCANACLEDGSADAQEALIALAGCLNEHACEDAECAEAFCGPELGACF